MKAEQEIPVSSRCSVCQGMTVDDIGIVVVPRCEPQRFIYTDGEGHTKSWKLTQETICKGCAK